MKSEFLIENIDKVSLIAGSVLGVGMIALSLSGGSNKNIDAVKSNLRTIAAQAEEVDSNVPSSALPGPSPSETFRQLLGNTGSVSPFPAWSMHRRPLLLRDVKERPTELICIHEPPNLEDPVVQHGIISLKWNYNDDNDYVDIDKYTVFRGVNLENPMAVPESFEKVAELDGAELTVTWEDTEVEPDFSYSYFVVSHASAAKRAVNSPGGARPPEKEVRSRITRNVTVPPDKVIWFSIINFDDEEFPDPEKDRIQCRVYKYNEETGEFSDKKSYRDLIIGRFPDENPTFVGEGDYRTNWYLYEHGWDDVLANNVKKRRYWVKVKNRRTDKVEKLIVGLEGRPHFD